MFEDVERGVLRAGADNFLQLLSIMGDVIVLVTQVGGWAVASNVIDHFSQQVLYALELLIRGINGRGELVPSNHVYFQSFVFVVLMVSSLMSAILVIILL